MTAQESKDNFWSKVEKTDGCWMWKGGKTDEGYGATNVVLDDDGEQRWMRAHRAAYILTHGTPEKPELHHICEEKLCVRPDHLKPVTRKEHMNLTPGTYGYKWARRTHCEAGHPFNSDNLLPFATKAGFRRCRECSRLKSKAWREANPEKMRAAAQRWVDNNRERKRKADRDRQASKRAAGKA